MTEDVRQPRRSGCAVLVGVFLIVTGSIALAYNLSGFLGISFVGLASQFVSWFGTYWPALFIAWGIYKIYVRIRHPERSYVGVAEVVILAWILILGLAVQESGRLLEKISVNVALDEIAGIVGPEFLGPGHHFTQRETYAIETAPALVIDNEHGDIAVSGWDEDYVEVLVTRRVHDFSEVDAEAIAAEHNIAFTVDEERAWLRTSRPDDSRLVLTDLDIRAPASLRVTIHNGRGAIRVADLKGSVEVSTSHARVDGENLEGGVSVATSHAPIRLERITGRVEARTRNGGVVVTSIDGDLFAETRDGSVNAEGVSGSATLRTRRASIRATDIEGRVEIEAQDAEVSVERARQGVAIATSNRPVFVSDVEGELTLATRNSRVIARDIRGDVVIENQYRHIRLADIDGRVRVDGPQCEVDLESITGPIEIESSHEDVRVADFASSLEIRSSHAPLRVSTNRLTGAVHLETTYGDVELQLPGDVSASLTVTTRDGELRSEFSALGSSDSVSGQDGERQWSATLSGGTHPLRISTSYGNVDLSKVLP